MIAPGAASRRLDSVCQFCFDETLAVWHIGWTVKTITIAINGLFEFEGRPASVRRHLAGSVEAMARRQCKFLRQPLQVVIGGAGP